LRARGRRLLNSWWDTNKGGSWHGNVGSTPTAGTAGTTRFLRQRTRVSDTRKNPTRQPNDETARHAVDNGSMETIAVLRFISLPLGQTRAMGPFLGRPPPPIICCATNTGRNTSTDVMDVLYCSVPWSKSKSVPRGRHSLFVHVDEAANWC
jgi:hypothetical protein